MNKLNATAHTWELKGTSYEIGQAVGRMAAHIPLLRDFLAKPQSVLGPEDMRWARELFDRWCPGLNEEMAGCAEVLGVAPEQIVYYAMTCLVPRCCNIAVLPGMTDSGHTLVARSYEFSHEAEEFTLVRTCIDGRYAHLGTSVMQFGREEGINDQGLIVSMSSCGFPVGPQPFMRNPALRGLMFWAVIRALLENCRDVNEALAYLEGMPISFNINLMLADRRGVAALYETMDGSVAHKRIDTSSPESFLYATNHIRLPELLHLEPRAMRHSKVRADAIGSFMAGRDTVSADGLKDLLLRPYPDGPNCPFYSEYFGTTKSILMNAQAGTLDICWGGDATHGWRSYCVAEPLAPSETRLTLADIKADPREYEFIPL